MIISDKTKFFISDFKSKTLGQDIVLFDPDYPNWIAIDESGEKVFTLIKEKYDFGEIVKRYAEYYNLDTNTSWLHVNSLIKTALRENFISKTENSKEKYKGRANHLKLEYLKEFWIHINNVCNLSCSHCLVSSGPKGDKGLSSRLLKKTIDQAINLGTKNIFITGGEPFLRDDIFEIVDYITNEKGVNLIILTNATLITDETAKKLSLISKDRLRLQISLDGSCSDINDSIRGKGSFEKTVLGIKSSLNFGFNPTVTSAVTKKNADDIKNITKFISDLGVKNHHLLWLHERGRATLKGDNLFLTPDEILKATREVRKISKGNCISVDNYEAIRPRITLNKGIKYDGSNSCWNSLCICPKGNIYPSASLSGVESLSMGNINDTVLSDIWKSNSISTSIRNTSLINKDKCLDCHIKFLCGGGDMEYTYLNSVTKETKSSFMTEDPYCLLYKGIIYDIIEEKISQSKGIINNFKKLTKPIIISTREKLRSCIDDGKGENKTKGGVVETLHSNCVLTLDIDRSRQQVRDFYSKAAEEPQEDLCCPTKYDVCDTSHIPDDVLKRFYGCGSPMSGADIKKGETVIDLGSGAGIDCFIAAKYVGNKGKVIGVDMTDSMLEVANRCKHTVSKNLGYNVVEFRKGFLEEIPVETKSVDLITSNCVINLSPDKKQVFNDMWRVLTDFGRIHVSDIVSEVEVPDYMQSNPILWGECISGALTEDSFISILEDTGFYGVCVSKKTFWKEVEGYNFYSITARAYKQEKSLECSFIGEKALYLGPLKAVMDEEGHFFPRNEEVKVCTDTAKRLRRPPYSSCFKVTGEKKSNSSCCGGDTGSSC